jgi:hypothetical protein
LAKSSAHYPARAVPNQDIAEFQRYTGGAIERVRKSRHVPQRTVGNLRRSLQVRYCSAALNLDERMQI